MKATVYFFHSDNDNGDNVALHTSRAALAADIHNAVESYDQDRAARMRALPFESPEWLAEWEDFRETESHYCNYFTYGSEDLELILQPSARTWQPDTHDEMRVAVVSSQHITPADRAQLMKAHPRDVLATLYENSGHIIHSDSDEDLATAFPSDRFSEAFRALMQHFRTLGFEYLRIDENGPVVAGLPTF